MSRKLNENSGVRGKVNLSEQSTDEGKPDNVTHLDGEAHGTSSAVLTGVSLGGE